MTGGLPPGADHGPPGGGPPAAGDPPDGPLPFRVRRAAESPAAEPGAVVLAGEASWHGGVARWKDWRFWSADLAGLRARAGERYRLEIPGRALSEPFEVAEDLLLARTLPAALGWFRERRCSGAWDEADRRAPFAGYRSDRVDVHGGWYDASGDLSKYLSHLSYANYMNPQQSPLVVWAFLSARDLLADAWKAPALQEKLLEEALYGAEFLARMQDPDGYFYTTVFDRWTKDPAERQICSFHTQKGIRTDAYRAGWRQGGGMAVAALASAGRVAAAGAWGPAPAGGGGPRGETGPRAWLRAAESGFRHLEAHGRGYLDDGRENIIDDYCALLAAAELYAATAAEGYLAAARRRAEGLVGRLARDGRYRGWWRADERGERPFFHAADAGLPAIALLRYLEVEPDAGRAAAGGEAVRASLEFELALTAEVANPFGLARQYVKPVGGQKRSAFFHPHLNETGYWWQGENARLASLAAAARLAARAFPGEEGFAGRLRAYAADQLDWILGRNPFDACLLHGFGRGNPEYEERWPNTRGGICNGITGGFLDEEDIDFLPLPWAEQGEHRWRWSEQWLPHGTWYLLAVCAGA